MSNNGNFNYLDTIPETTSTPSYLPAQQYSQTFNTQQQPQMMGPNGQMINRPELDQAINKFQKPNPKYDNFAIFFSYLPKRLNDYYKKWFDYLDTIKQRRGPEEYLSDLRKLLSKMNEYVSKTEQTIIKLKKTLDYTETTLPVQQQYQPIINGTPQLQNTFMIHELQNVIEKDNHIEFVDIFGLKGKNISHIRPEDRTLILIVVQSLMGFVPPPTPDPRTNTKLMYCLNKLKVDISDYSIQNVADTNKLNINIEDPFFKPLVQIDIYSKMFDIFDKGSINIKDIKTDKILERIESSPNKSPSPSYQSSQSPFGFLHGGFEPSFGGPRRNNRKDNNKKKWNHQGSKPEHNIQAKIKKIAKYEVGSTNTGNINFELEKTVQKKGKDLTEYLFFNEEFMKELQNISIYKENNSNNNSSNNSSNNSNNNTQINGGASPQQQRQRPQQQRPQQQRPQQQQRRQQQRPQAQSGKRITNDEKYLLTGNRIIEYIKDTKDTKETKETRGQLKKDFIEGNFSKFINEIQSKYTKDIRSHIGLKNSPYRNSNNSNTSFAQTETQKIKKKNTLDNLEQTIAVDENKLSSESTTLTEAEKRELNQKITTNKKRVEDIRTALKYSITKNEIESIVSELNTKLQSRIEQYQYRILKCGEESFTKSEKIVKDFFTGTLDRATGDQYKNIKNNEKKSLYFIQIYIMMYEAYKEYYKKYSIETIIKSFSKDTIKKDNETKMSILNGLGLYSVLIYNKIKQVRDTLKSTLQQTNPDFEKAKTMLLKVQTLINSSPDEEKKKKLLKMKKNIEEQINKLPENRGQEQQYKNRGDFGEKKGFDKSSKPYNKPYGDKKYKNQGDFGEKKGFDKNSKPYNKPYVDKRYTKSYNNNVSL